MSIADTLRRAHKARLERIAARAVPPEPALPSPASRYVMDRNYERAWAAVILGYGGDRRRTRPQIEEIQQATAEYFGLTREDLLAHETAVALSRPRHVAMYLAREMTVRSVADIGEAFAGRDHTTVLHAVKRVRDLVARDEEFRRRVDSIRAALNQIVTEDMT